MNANDEILEKNVDDNRRSKANSESAIETEFDAEGYLDDGIYKNSLRSRKFIFFKHALTFVNSGESGERARLIINLRLDKKRSCEISEECHRLWGGDWANPNLNQDMGEALYKAAEAVLTNEVPKSWNCIGKALREEIYASGQENDKWWKGLID